MKGNYIGLTALIDRVKTNPLMRGLDFDIAVRYAIDCLKLIGTKKIFTEKPFRIGIEDYRGRIPDDIISLQQIRRVHNAGEGVKELYKPMREATDTFQQTYNKTTSGTKSSSSGMLPEDAYSINEYYIHTGFEEGVVDMMYLGIAVDVNGYPLIPDEIDVIKAIENYIKQEYYTILFELGKIPAQELSKVETEYCWYVARAQSVASMMSLDERAAISNIIHKMFIERDQHGDYYRNLGTIEHLRKH